jgi:hypothetical protein
VVVGSFRLRALAWTETLCFPTQLISLLRKLWDYTGALTRIPQNDLLMLSDAQPCSVLSCCRHRRNKTNSLRRTCCCSSSTWKEAHERQSTSLRVSSICWRSIPWTISQQFGLKVCSTQWRNCSNRRSPIGTGMGYGSQATELWLQFYNGEMVSIAQPIHRATESAGRSRKRERR